MQFANHRCGEGAAARVRAGEGRSGGGRLRLRWVALAAALALSACSLAGCGGNVSTDDAAGIPAESSQASNLVNTSQLPDSSFIYDASIADLEQADSYMDGQTVQITGEVVGDRITSDYDGDWCWITLQATDGTDAEMDVYMPVSRTRIIDTYGAYGRRGTTLQVRGTFNLACVDHDGLTEIHAANVSLVRRGAVEAVRFDFARFMPGIALLVFGGALIFAYRYLSEKRR